MRRIARVLVLAALLVMQSGAVDRAYGSPARTPNYPGVDVSNGCYIYTDGKIFCNDGGYALSGIVPQYVNQKVQIVLVVEVQGALQVCLAGSCVNASNSEVITFPEFGETPYGAPDLLQVTCISGPVRWYISQVNLIPISVPATATDTATVNPSSTATNTVVPGSTDTPIPTSTPRGQVQTTTPSPTPSPTPSVPTERDCGAPAIPVRNCDWLGGVLYGAAADHWVLPLGTVSNTLAYCGASQGFPTDQVQNLCYQADANMIYQPITVTASGPIVVNYQQTFSTDQEAVFAVLDNGTWSDAHTTTPTCTVGSSTYCSLTLTTVTSGDSIRFAVGLFDGGQSTIYISDVHIVGEAATAIPSATLAAPTDTPYPVPGASLTPYPSPTACEGGACAAQDATQIPAAIDTVVGIDTSPLTPLELLSVGRTSCQSFGAIPLVEPHLYGTPIYGSSQPISITWTVPATGTQFQPCADPSFSSAWWDTMWNLSILVAIVCWIGWLIHWVRSLFS